jgi:hypothetical protein
MGSNPIGPAKRFTFKIEKGVFVRYLLRFLRATATIVIGMAIAAHPETMYTIGGTVLLSVRVSSVEDVGDG